MLGERLKKLRTTKKLTQEELGKKVNVTKVSISGYENGNRTPDTETLQKIADVFDVSTDYLLGRTDDSSQPLSTQKKIKKHLQLKDGEQIFFYDMEEWDDEEIEMLKAQIELHRKMAERRKKRGKK